MGILTQVQGSMVLELPIAIIIVEKRSLNVLIVKGVVRYIKSAVIIKKKKGAALSALGKMSLLEEKMIKEKLLSVVRK